MSLLQLFGSGETRWLPEKQPGPRQNGNTKIAESDVEIDGEDEPSNDDTEWSEWIWDNEAGNGGYRSRKINGKWCYDFQSANEDPGYVKLGLPRSPSYPTDLPRNEFPTAPPQSGPSIYSPYPTPLLSDFLPSKYETSPGQEIPIRQRFSGLEPYHQLYDPSREIGTASNASALPLDGPRDHHIAADDRQIPENDDPRYRLHPGKDFKFGRVFKIRWTEPEGNAQLPDSQGFTKVRPFLIIRQSEGHCMCLPILTYSGQATTKGGVNPDHHAIIYTSSATKRRPTELPGEEKLRKKAIRIIPLSARESLDPRSRLNYHKIYTIEWNVKVNFIGSIDPKHIDHLKRDYNMAHTPLPRAAGFQYAKDDSEGSPPLSLADVSPKPPTRVRPSEVRSPSSPLPRRPQLEEVYTAGQINTALDPQYVVIKKPKAFFKVGRIFMTLWSEPARINTEQLENVFHLPNGEAVFTKIRRFVVVREGQGFSLCCSINASRGQDTLTQSSTPQHHAIVYPHGSKPLPTAGEETPGIGSLPMVIEDDSLPIDPVSHLIFNKVYTVEHNVRVRKVGRIDRNHLNNLNQAFLRAMGSSVPEKSDTLEGE